MNENPRRLLRRPSRAEGALPHQPYTEGSDQEKGAESKQQPLDYAIHRPNPIMDLIVAQMRVVP